MSSYAGKGRTGTHADHFNEMKRHVDTNDPFIFAKVVAPRKYGTRGAPDWALDKVRVQRVLLSAFPRMYENSERGHRQRDDAARWATVIHLYFIMKYTSRQVAEELFGYSRSEQVRNGRRDVPGECKIRGIIQAIQSKAKAIESGNARQRGRPAGNPVVVEIL
jgi:hypothetical protein